MAQENSKAKESLAKWSILYTKSHFGNHNKLLVPDNPGAEPKELHKPSPSPELCPHHLHPNHPWGGKPEPLTSAGVWEATTTLSRSMLKVRRPKGSRLWGRAAERPKTPQNANWDNAMQPQKITF